MESTNLVVIGAGHVSHMPHLAASLALYFGERPLNIALFDANDERLDLCHRLCLVAFKAAHSHHKVWSTTSLAEACEGAGFAILSIGNACAQAMKLTRGEAYEVALGSLPSDAYIVALRTGESIPADQRLVQIDWPEKPSPSERAGLPLQILRYLNGEDYLIELFEANRNSPLREWLDHPEQIPAIKPEQI